MKKVKIMLTAVTVFAVVGGALAFEAKTKTKFYCADTPEQACTIERESFSTFNLDPQANKIINCTDAPTTETCPSVSLIQAL
jgi:hypothetical protein